MPSGYPGARWSHALLSSFLLVNDSQGANLSKCRILAQNIDICKSYRNFDRFNRFCGGGVGGVRLITSST